MSFGGTYPSGINTDKLKSDPLRAAATTVVCSGNLLILARTLLVPTRWKFGRRWFQEIETVPPLDSSHAGFSEEVLHSGGVSAASGNLHRRYRGDCGHYHGMKHPLGQYLRA